MIANSDKQHDSVTTHDEYVCVISGTSRGLGRGLAQRFLDKGHVVVGCSRGQSQIVHDNYFHSEVDLTDYKAVVTWAKQIRKQHGRVDVLICNAALVESALLLPATSTEQFEKFSALNFGTNYILLREFSKIMLLQKFGRILLISSTMAAVHHEGTSLYSATKAASTEMCKVLAKELAPQGITCNIIAPGMMETDASRALSKSENWVQEMFDLQTVKRPISTQEVGHVAEFLMSRESSALTGQVLYVGLVD